jgi:hypothetical protein
MDTITNGNDNAKADKAMDNAAARLAINLNSWVNNYLKLDDKLGEFVAKAQEAGLIPPADHVGKFTPNEQAMTQFVTMAINHYAKNVAEQVFYQVLDEQGRIALCQEGEEGAKHLSVHYAVSLTASDLGKLQGHRDEAGTVKHLVCQVRDSAKKYVDKKLERLRNAADKARGVKAPVREFWVFFQDECAKIGKRAKKDGICSEAEFSVALQMFKSRIEGNK